MQDMSTLHNFTFIALDFDFHKQKFWITVEMYFATHELLLIFCYVLLRIYICILNKPLFTHRSLSWPVYHANLWIFCMQVSGLPFVNGSGHFENPTGFDYTYQTVVKEFWGWLHVGDKGSLDKIKKVLASYASSKCIETH